MSNQYGQDLIKIERKIMANNNPNYKPTINNKVIIDYIPHGICSNTYKPLSLENQGEIIKVKNKDKEMEMTEFEAMLDFRKNLFQGNDYKFSILFNNRNIRRKMPGDIILAYKTFLDGLSEKERDDVVLIMHTAIVDENGTDLAAVKEAIAPDDTVIFSNAKLDLKQMNFLYNIADVTINMASNEGYGLSTAESLMAGTPIIVNITGGLQDQCGFVDENNKYLDPDIHYNNKWGSNHDGKYKKHGKWVKPIFPSNRSLVGSPPTPYIFDDRCDWQDAAKAIKYWYDMKPEFRKKYGLMGKKFMEETGMTAQKMGLRFIDYIDESIKKFTKRKRFNIYEI